jgi:DNA-binding NarL/FixJ family response regulator
VFPIEDDALQAAVDPLLVQLGSARLALVRLRDRESTVRRQAARGAAQYGFTRAETAVAEALLRGMTAAEIAALKSVSEQTVRSQIRALLEKSGSSRQAELIVKLGASLG